MIHFSPFPPIVTDPTEAWSILLLPHAGIILRITTCPTCGGVMLRQANLAVCESCGILDKEIIK